MNEDILKAFRISRVAEILQSTCELLILHNSIMPRARPCPILSELTNCENRNKDHSLHSIIQFEPRSGMMTTGFL